MWQMQFLSRDGNVMDDLTGMIGKLFGGNK